MKERFNHVRVIRCPFECTISKRYRHRMKRERQNVWSCDSVCFLRSFSVAPTAFQVSTAQIYRLNIAHHVAKATRSGIRPSLRAGSIHAPGDSDSQHEWIFLRGTVHIILADGFLIGRALNKWWPFHLTTAPPNEVVANPSVFVHDTQEALHIWTRELTPGVLACGP